MKTVLYSFCACLLFAACSTNSPEKTEDTSAEEQTENTPQETDNAQPSLTMVWETDTLLTTNESVLYSPKDRVLYVSCINGKPLEKNGKGFIAKLATDGSTKELDWADDLNAPKGMAIFDGHLYTTNIDELVKISLQDGNIEQRYRIAAAEFLNDVTVGDEIVYFSDMNTGRIHMLTDGGVKTLAENVTGINGLAFANNTLYGLSGAGLISINTTDGSTTVLNAEVTGGDGLLVLDENTFLASRWQGEIWLIQSGVATKLLDSAQEEIQTADIGYMPEEKMVFVPRFFSNKVTAYKLNY